MQKKTLDNDRTPNKIPSKSLGEECLRISYPKDADRHFALVLGT